MNASTTATITIDISNESAVDKVIFMLEEANREWRRQKHAADLAADTSARDVHTGHCCLRHGCKYGYDLEGGEQECTVANGSKVQDYFEQACCVDVYDELDAEMREAELAKVEDEANAGFTFRLGE
jgi:hypothetical protein